MTDKLHVAALILVLAILASLLAVSASTKQTPLPTTYLETYHGYRIYMLDGGHDPYYVALSLTTNRCEVYINLSDLKADLEG